MKFPMVIALGLIASVSSALAAEPDLVGTWTGERERIAADADGYTKGPLTLVITGQNGPHLRRTSRPHLSRQGRHRRGPLGRLHP